MPHVFTANEREKIIAYNLDLVSASKVDLTDDMLDLAQQLAAIHGRVRVCNESSGIHVYLPCPECLSEDEGELQKSHLAINLSKYYLQAGDQDKKCTMCMKTSTTYSISDLLSMPPLNERGHELRPDVVKVAVTKMESMELDPVSGAWIPRGPGEVTPVFQLPANHPAQIYLQSRNFDAHNLWKQFRLSYCSKEKDGVYHRRMLNGFRATPQGRLIFFIDQEGINRGWQSRIIDIVRKDVKYYWHPYANKWIPVLKRVGKRWVPMSEAWVGWDEVKYCLSSGCRRNACLLGFDAAVAWSKANSPDGACWCVLAEGGLDAGRLGPPAMAMMGKSFSAEQCKLVADNFNTVIYVKDKDEAGEQAAGVVEKRFLDLHNRVIPQLKITAVPGDCKDLGDMGNEEAASFIAETLHTTT